MKYHFTVKYERKEEIATVTATLFVDYCFKAMGYFDDYPLKAKAPQHRAVQGIALEQP